MSEMADGPPDQRRVRRGNVTLWLLARFSGPSAFGMAPRFPTNFVARFSTDSAAPYNTLLYMSTQGQGQGITFAPACIGTSIDDAEFKLRFLRKALEDESIQSQRQRRTSSSPYITTRMAEKFLLQDKLSGFSMVKWLTKNRWKSLKVQWCGLKKFVFPEFYPILLPYTYS